jgi:hypothetical protein
VQEEECKEINGIRKGQGGECNGREHKEERVNKRVFKYKRSFVVDT